MVVLAGVALAFLPSLAAILIALALIGAGTFFLQAAATGFVGRTALTNRAAANGLYLTCYYVGGLAGAVVLGLVNDAGGWIAVNGVVGLVVLALIPCARALTSPGPEVVPRNKAA
jgi:MFS family permease